MEWLQYGTYTFEPLHPPLARVAVALGPYLAGLRLKDHGNLWTEGNELRGREDVISITSRWRVQGYFPSSCSPFCSCGSGRAFDTVKPQR